MIRSTTIIGKLVLNLAKVIFMLQHSIKLVVVCHLVMWVVVCHLVMWEHVKSPN